MLTPQQIDLIKATVPILRENGLALITHFYDRMLTGNPELKNIFNQVHQTRGYQQKALADAVLAYAENIENPTVLLPAVKFIASKHVTVGIRSEHYPIVGKHLLASIKEVLGESASDQLIDAWAAAYGQLAELMIQVESDIYQAQTYIEGGWSGWRPFKVSMRVQEAPSIVSFYLTPVDGGKVPAYKPGQFVSVRAYIPEIQLVQPRQYSLSTAPQDNDTLRITVKRIDAKNDMPAGLMSNYLHQNLKEGDTIDVSAPGGEFYLSEGNHPVILIAGGIGITPIFAMFKHIAKTTPERQVALIQAARTASELALVNEVPMLAEKLQNVQVTAYVTQPTKSDLNIKCPHVKVGKKPCIDDFRQLALSPDTEAYICGPTNFMNDMKLALEAVGVSPERINTEIFGTGGQV